MVRTTKHHFSLFKKAVLETIDKLKIGGYDISFAHSFIEGEYGYSEMTANIMTCATTFNLNTWWDETECPLNDKEIIKCGKHEAAHLLLAELQILGNARFVSADEIKRATEAAVVTITELL